MKRTQLYLDEAIWRGLQSRALTESTTISELVRKAVRTQYFNPADSRAEAMQALVGIRANDKDPEDSTAVVRRMRKGTRLSRLTTYKSK